MVTSAILWQKSHVTPSAPCGARGLAGNGIVPLACHMGITIQQANGTIPLPASPLAPQGAEGVTCDFCHKIADVTIDPKTNLPPPDMPGILSLKLLRPANDSQQVFFGTLIDSAPGQ